MLKRNKNMIILTTLLMLIPMLLGVILWNKLPDVVPTHFDSAGVPNGYSSKAFAVFGTNGFVMGCHVLAALATAADPRRQGISDKVYRLILWICPVICLFMSVVVYGYALDYRIDVPVVAGLLVGIVFVVIGNYLPKCKQNYTVGIKLPWTMNDAENWNATHRMAGPLWIVSGFLMIIMTLLGMQQTWVLIGVIVIAALIPTIYSFVFYIRKENRS